MDQAWLTNLDQDTAIIVPTRSLASALNEQIAHGNVAQGKAVWEAPNILVWSDYQRLLWQLNRTQLGEYCSAHTLISSQQALLLWYQVIEASRREENALTLLNVQQTARAVQRSWRLMNDWQISLDSLNQDHVADTTQFIHWVEAYNALLNKRALVDESALLTVLSERIFLEQGIAHPFKKLIWVSYDLITKAQQAYLNSAKSAAIEVSQVRPKQTPESEEWYVYADTKSEITATLESARRLLELDARHTISIVVPDLQHRQAQVQELARAVFYPGSSPLDVQQNNNVYKFSLGQALNEWAAIEAALSLIQLLKNRTSSADLSFILRNQFMGLCNTHRGACRLFEQWLKRQRIHNITFDYLPALYQQCLDSLDKADDSSLLLALENLVTQRQSIQAQLQAEKDQSGFAALSFSEWLSVFSTWLDAWGWRTTTNTGEMSSVQFQLQQGWISLLEEFAGLATVQRRTGLSRSIDVLQQMVRNTIFLPKAAASPILISGVFEAIGREVDTCFLTGMHQDYPAPPQNDAFIPNRLLVQVGHPEATAESGFNHACNVINGLLDCAQNRIISYAQSSDHDRDVLQQSSPLFSAAWFNKGPAPMDLGSNQPVLLESYIDTRGPSWHEPGRARGGSRIFENQSICAFKAFATHQLGFRQDDESEFGLDGLDRGNVLHHCLNLLWQEIQSQSELLVMDEAARLTVINKVIHATFSDGELVFSTDKAALLKHEVPRLQAILLDWLEIESQRPMPFSVVEREEQREGELGGIRFRYIIDRVDITEDGRTAIIDYKTGMVNRNDWIGERLKSPQMPLYVLALDQAKRKPTSGIAFAQIKQGDSKYIELAETELFRKARTRHEQRYADLWEENRAAWPAIFEQLAKDFLAGEASVNPIDEQSCRYCELHSLCRVHQLRAQS